MVLVVTVCTIKVPLSVTQKPSKTFAIFKTKKIFKNFLKKWRNKLHHNPTFWRKSVKILECIWASFFLPSCPPRRHVPPFLSSSFSFSLWTSGAESWVIYAFQSWRIINVSMSLALLLFYFIIFPLSTESLLSVPPLTTGGHSKMLYSCICTRHWRIYCIYVFSVYIHGTCYRSCSVSFLFFSTWSVYSADVHLAHCCVQLHDVW